MKDKLGWEICRQAAALSLPCPVLLSDLLSPSPPPSNQPDTSAAWGNMSLPCQMLGVQQTSSANRAGMERGALKYHLQSESFGRGNCFWSVQMIPLAIFGEVFFCLHFCRVNFMFVIINFMIISSTLWSAESFQTRNPSYFANTRAETWAEMEMSWRQGEKKRGWYRLPLCRSSAFSYVF